MAVEIRLLHDTELELANNFFNEIYRTNRTFENFTWEFISGPAGKAIYIVAVDTTDAVIKIVGTQCAIPLELIGADGKTILTAKSEDTLVHPSYRGQKLFEKMYDLLFAECAKAGIKYIWGFTPALKAFERIGFEAPFKTQQALMVIKPVAAYHHLASLNQANTVSAKIKIFSLSMLSWIKGWGRFFTASTSLAFDEVPAGDKDDLLKKLYAPNPLYYFIRQHERYNHWRLTQNPFRNLYKNYSITNKKEVKANVLTNQREGVSYLEQMLFAEDLSVNERASILRRTVETLVKTKAPLIRVLCFDNNDEAIKQNETLRKTGFILLKRGNYFVWKSLDPENKISVTHVSFSRLFTQGNI